MTDVRSVTRDCDRKGDDLLDRIEELTKYKREDSGNGWRNVLWAAGSEIKLLRRELRGIAAKIQSNESMRE